jgi:hypothetical protein
MADPYKSDENKEQLCAWHEFLKNDSYVDRKERNKLKAQRKAKAAAFAAGKGINASEPVPEETLADDDNDKLVLSALEICKAIIYYSTNLKYHRWYSLQFVRFLSFMQAATPFYTHVDMDTWNAWSSVFVVSVN